MLTSTRVALICLGILIPIIFYFEIIPFHSVSLNVSPQTANTNSTAVTTVPAIGKDGSQDPVPRILQVSMVFGKSESVTIERSLKLHIQHGKRWGVSTRILRQDVLGKGDWLKLVFDKIMYLQGLMIEEMAKSPDQRSEWVVWFDSDTILLNQNIPWRVFLPPEEGFDDVHFLGVKDFGGLNNGVFFLRVTAWTVRMLSDVLALPSLRPEIDLGVNTEQFAMKWVFSQLQNVKHVLYQPRHWYNGYERTDDSTPLVQNGDMLVHFPGYLDAKEAAMRRWLEKLDLDDLNGNRTSFQIDFENTIYPQQIPAYWDRLRKAQQTLQQADEFRRVTQAVDSNRARLDAVGSAAGRLRQTYCEEAFNDQLMEDALAGVNDALRVVHEDTTKPEMPLSNEPVAQTETLPQEIE